jgi:hypothetical protein
MGLLQVEHERLERHGVRVHTLASRLETLEFASFDDWLRFQLYSWSPPGRDAFAKDKMEAIHRFCEGASSQDGKICVTVHTLWLAGAKAEPTAANQTLQWTGPAPRSQ